MIPSSPSLSDEAPALDARSALFAFASLAAWIMLIETLVGASIWLIVTILLAITVESRLRTGMNLLTVLRWSLPFAVVVSVLYVLFNQSGDRSIWEWGPIGFGWTDVDTGARLALRFLSFVILARMLTMLVTPNGLAAGVTRLLWPLKWVGVPIESVYYLMFFIVRMIPILAEEGRIIQFGQRSRGLAPATSWRGKVTGSAALIIPVFAAATRRSESLAMVLASRGFDTTRLPAVVRAQRFRAIDWVLTLAVVAGWLVFFESRYGWMSRYL